MDRRRPYSCKSEPACWRAFYICNGWRLFPVYVPARTKFIALVVIARNKMDAGLNKNLRCLPCNDSRMSNSCRVRNVLRIIFIRNFVTTYRFLIRHCDWRSRRSKIEDGESENEKNCEKWEISGCLFLWWTEIVDECDKLSLVSTSSWYWSIGK